MHRRRFLGGLLAAAGLAKAGALGAEEELDPAVEWAGASPRQSPRPGDMVVTPDVLWGYVDGRWVRMDFH